MNKRALKLLIERNQRLRDRAAVLAAESQRRTIQAEQTARMLANYRDEYRAKAPQRSAQAASADRYVMHLAFAGKLDESMTEQQSIVLRLQQQQQQASAELNQSQIKLKAMQALAERRKRRELALAQRAERRDDDELAQAVARRRLDIRREP